MKILFDKVGHTPKAFEYQHANVLISGTVAKEGHHKVALKAHLSGETSLDCVRCGDSFSYSLDNDLDLMISDEVVETQDSLDIIEFLDGIIDIEYITQSEIDSIEASYNYCAKCAGALDEDFEVEF